MGEIDDEIKFKRYLYFLTENQQYVVQKKDNIFTNKIDSLLNLLAADKITKIIEIIEEASKFEWLPNRNVLFHVLALCTKTSDNPTVKTASYSCAARLIKNIEELIQFICYERALQKNASSGLRRVIKLWYLEQDTDKLYDAIVNVRSFHGYTHRDILRQAHIKAKEEDKRVLLAYAARGLEHAKKQSTEKTKDLIDKLEAIDNWRFCKDEKKAVELAAKSETSYKSIPGALIKSVPVWTSLIPKLPLDLLILELARFHRLGMFKLNQPSLTSVVDALGDVTKCKNSGLQPANVLLHMKLFERPRPTDPKLREYLKTLVKKEGVTEVKVKEEVKEEVKAEKQIFSRSHAVTAALGRLLHHSLRNIKPLSAAKKPKTVMVTIEVRGGEGVEGLLRPCFGANPLRYGEAAALLVLILQRLVSDKHLIVATFNGSENINLVNLLKEAEDTKDVKTEPGVKSEGSKKGSKDKKSTKDASKDPPKISITLAQVLQRLRDSISTKPGANPSRPLRYALENKKNVDVFINLLVTADSLGRIPKPERPKEDTGAPYDNLIKYRQKSKINNAKMLNIALCGRSTQAFAQGVPTCPGYLNIAGFNTMVPSLINAFISGPFI